MTLVSLLINIEAPSEGTFKTLAFVPPLTRKLEDPSVLLNLTCTSLFVT